MARILSRVTSSVLRAAQIVFAAVVLAIMAYWIHQGRQHGKNSQPEDERVYLGDFPPVNIFATSLSAASVLTASLLQIPHMNVFWYLPIDFTFGAAWFACFALLIVRFQGGKCDQGLGELATMVLGGSCNQNRAAWGFSFLSGCVWIAGSVIGAWVVWRERKAVVRGRGSGGKGQS